MEQNTNQTAPQIQQPKKKKKFSRRLRYGGFATLMIAVFVVVVVIINVIANVLVDKYSLTLDLTASQVFDLSEETQPYVESIQMPVKITVLAKESDMLNYKQATQMNTIIKKIAQLNPNLTLEYADIVEDPTFASNYPDLSLSAYSVIVESELRQRVISLSDMFPTESSSSSSSSSTQDSKVEQKMLSALLYVTADDTYQIAFLNGHEESKPSALVSLLEANNYEVVDANISLGGIGEEVDAVVICNPTRDYSAEELQNLSDYLNNEDNLGKAVFYFADPSQPELPNLEEFLKEWGIVMGTGTAAESDTNKMFYQNPYYATGVYSDPTDKFSSLFADRDLNLIVPGSREMSLAFTETGNREAVTILQLSDTSIVVPKTVDENFTSDDAAVKGNIPVMILGGKDMYDADNNLIRSQVLACGSTAILQSQFLQNTSLVNGDYVVNLFNRIINVTESVYVAPKDMSYNLFQISAGQAIGIGVGFAIVLPLAVLACGLAVWLRRRHL